MARQARATHTRRAVITAAAREFDLAGYQGSSLARISKSSEMSMGALTFHFPTKGELADAVLAEGTALTQEALSKVVARPSPALDTVIAVTLELARLLERETVVRAAARLSRELPHGKAVWHALWVPLLEQLLWRTGPGEVRPGTDPALVVTLATHLVIGAEAHVRGRLRAPETHPGSADERLLGLWRLVMLGVTGREIDQSAHICPCAGPGETAQARKDTAQPAVRASGDHSLGLPRGQGVTLWLTGPSRAEGIIVAHALARHLSDTGHAVEVLGSSALRDGLASGASSPRERHESGIRRVGMVAAALARSGVKAVVALPVPRHESRLALRERHALQDSHFLEVHVGSPVGAGAPDLGKDAADTDVPYEKHVDPDLYLAADVQSVAESVGQLLDLLSAHGLL